MNLHTSIGQYLSQTRVVDTINLTYEQFVDYRMTYVA